MYAIAIIRRRTNSQHGRNMKRIDLVALLAILAISTPTVGLAQGTTLGVKGGLSSAIHRGLNGSGDTLNVTRRTGSHFGVFVAGDFVKRFGFQIEGLYVEKGSQDPAGQGSLALSYLEIPAMLKVWLPISRSDIHVFMGPALSYEIRCRLTGFEGPVLVTLGCDDSLLGVETKKLEVGLRMGGGVSFSVGAGWVVFDVAYDLGLTHVNDVTGSLGDFKNRALLFSAGLALPISGTR